MTVNTEDSRNDYVGNGITTLFPVTFYFFADEHLIVYLTDLNDNTVEQVLNTDYTVTGAGNPAGGSITMVVPPPVDYKLAILRNVPLTQLLDYIENDRFPAQSHENGLDKLTMLTQQLQEEIERSFRVGVGYPNTSLELIPEPLNFLRWNEDATELGNYPTTTTADGLYYNTIDLRLLATVDGVKATLNTHYIRANNDNIAVSMVTNGAISLYHAGVKNLETLGTGISATDGTNEAYLYISSNDTKLVGQNNGGNVIIGADNSAGSEKALFRGDPDGASELYYAGGKRLETNNPGVTIYGATGSTIIDHGATTNIISKATGADLFLYAANSADSNTPLFSGDPDGEVKLYYAGDVIVQTDKASGAYYGIHFAQTSVKISQGSGTPEGNLTANAGSLYMRIDGAGGPRFYVKESGSGNTGWVAK